MPLKNSASAAGYSTHHSRIRPGSLGFRVAEGDGEDDPESWIWTGQS